jgi:hypothetical protein
MHRTRLSLFYLAGYLIPTGLGLMFAPGMMMSALFAKGDYGEIFPSFSGVLLLSLGILVVRSIQTRAETLYPATLVVRSIIWLWVLRLFFVSGDPLWAVILGVVGFGLALTGICYFADRAKARS